MRLLTFILLGIITTKVLGDPDPDPVYDKLRTRTDEPKSYAKVHMADLEALPNQFPQATQRSNWWPSDLQKVANPESHGICILGYMDHFSVNTLDQETSNAQGKFTIELQLKEIAGRNSPGKTLICHLSPTFLAAHPKITKLSLRELAENGTYFRISGWLLWESYHEIDTTTRLGWEISPVTHIEYFNNGLWTEL